MKTNILKKYLILALDGDSNAMKELLSLLYPLIYNFFINKGLDDCHSKDLTQESLIGIWKSLERYDVKRNFFSWTFTICHYKYVDFLRSKYSKSVSDEFDDQILYFKSFYDETELKDLLNYLVRNLKDIEKEILLRAKYNGEKIIEIANSLGKSESAIKMILTRSLKKVRKSNEDLI